MRILHVVPSYIPAYRYGGPIRSVHGLCRGLALRGHDVHVFTTNVDRDRDSDVPVNTAVNIEGVTVWYFPSKHLRRLYRSPQMKKALAASTRNFDLMHMHSIFLWPTFAAARAAEKAGVPYIISARGMLVKELIRRKNRLVKTAWLSLIERHNLEHADAIHVTSPTEAEDISRFGFKLPPVYTVPNGVCPAGDEAAPVSGRIRDIIGRPYLLFLGRVNWKKGLDRLIPAMSYIRDVPLIIAGNDEENYQPVLEGLAARKGVAGRVLFVGQVEGSDKAALLRNASVLVLPSYSENFGIVVLEAMSAGLPVVVTPEVGAAGIVKEAGAGIIVNGEPAELGKGIRSLLADPELAGQMGINGKRTVAEKFSWETIAAQMEAVYRKITDRRKRAVYA